MPLRRPVSFFLCLALLEGPALSASAQPAPQETPKAQLPLTDPRDAESESRLAFARQTARDLAFDASGRFLDDPFTEVEKAGGLWTTRVRLARASEAARRRDPVAVRQNLAGIDASRVGLTGLDSWLSLLASLPAGTSSRLVPTTALTGFAGQAPSVPLLAESLWHASLFARSTQDREALLTLVSRLPAISSDRPRLSTRRALIAARLAGREADRVAIFGELLAALPDAPERFPDHFGANDLASFSRAARSAPLGLRIARARTLIPRKTDEGIGLLMPFRDGTPAEQFAAAETLLLGGRLVDSRKEFQRLQAEGQLSPDLAQRVPPLLLSLEMRITLLRVSPRPASAPSAGSKKRGGKKRRSRGRKAEPQKPVAAPPPVVLAPAVALLEQAEATLKGALDPLDRRRLLSDAVRLATATASTPVARRLLTDLVSLDPSTSAGAEDLFRTAFHSYRTGQGTTVADAARDLEFQAETYKDNAVRRRALYWAGRARAKSGEREAARQHFSSLLGGPAADLYGRWAAAALGVPYPAPVLSQAVEAAPVLTANAAGPAEREFLAAGLPDLAEEAAETSGRTSPLLSALAAWDRREFRRAVVLLKNRFPELGTQKEQDVPLTIRRLYYPSVHTSVIEAAAADRNLPLPLVQGLIRQESIFEADARSWAGALGLMQVMPATGRQLYRQERGHGKPNLLDPAVNVKLGTRYIADMLRMFGGDVVAALAAYNAGPGRVQRWRREMGHLDMDEFVESIPLSEPRDYVKKVLYFKSAYSTLYGLPALTEVEQAGAKRLQVRLANP